MSENLTLYEIEAGIAELLVMREAPGADVDAINAQIESYLRAELKKADGIAAMIREFDARAKIAKEESKRLAERAAVYEKRRESLETMAIGIMVASGLNRIEGARSTLKLAKCPPSVNVRQPELVPDDWKRLKLTSSVEVWKRLMEWVKAHKADDMIGEFLAQLNTSPPEILKSEIAADLKAGAAVPGCELITDKMRLAIE